MPQDFVNMEEHLAEKLYEELNRTWQKSEKAGEHNFDKILKSQPHEVLNHLFNIISNEEKKEMMRFLLDNYEQLLPKEAIGSYCLSLVMDREDFHQAEKYLKKFRDKISEEDMGYIGVSVIMAEYSEKDAVKLIGNLVDRISNEKYRDLFFKSASDGYEKVVDLLLKRSDGRISYSDISDGIIAAYINNQEGIAKKIFHETYEHLPPHLLTLQFYNAYLSGKMELAETIAEKCAESLDTKDLLAFTNLVRQDRNISDVQMLEIRELAKSASNRELFEVFRYGDLFSRILSEMQKLEDGLKKSELALSKNLGSTGLRDLRLGLETISDIDVQKKVQILRALESREKENLSGYTNLVRMNYHLGTQFEKMDKYLPEVKKDILEKANDSGLPLEIALAIGKIKEAEFRSDRHKETKSPDGTSGPHNKSGKDNHNGKEMNLRKT